MNWSFSSSRSFEGCPRRWFYRQVVAHHAAKDPLRREAYLLGKLDSLWSWRGRLVDDVITQQVVPALAWGRVPALTPLLKAARRRYDAQLAYAETHRLREPGLRPAREPDFLALRETEQGAPPGEAELNRAWEDIETALTQLSMMRELLTRLKGATLLAQRPLTYKLELDSEPVTVRAVPDLLAFFGDAPPLIVDWKVHTHAAVGYQEQLVSYALALVRSSGQRGLPGLGRFSTQDISLLEVQLLTNDLRDYELTDEAVNETETRMMVSAAAMLKVLEDRPQGDRNPHTVPPTTELKRCDSCDFKNLCWDGGTGPKNDPVSGLLL